MARGFLGRKDRSPGTPTKASSDTTAVKTPTRGGSGTRKGRATSRSTAPTRSSTADSASGSTTRASSTDRLFTSISEQVWDLKLRRKKPALVLMSPATKYEMQSEPRDWWYHTGDSKTGTQVMGLDVVTVEWMPDGLVVVTDTYLPSLTATFKTSADVKALYDAVLGELAKSAKTSTSITTTTTTSTPPYISPYSTSTSFPSWFKPESIYSATASGVSVYPSHPKTYTYDENPTAWEVPIVESDPDPESIYGRALANARAAKSRGAKPNG